MAMEIMRVLDTGREVPTACMAYNKLRREVYSVTEGERSVKVGGRPGCSVLCCALHAAGCRL